jgi:hypothetical protein
LQCAGGDQCRYVTGHCAANGRERKEQQPGDKDAATSEAVAQRGADRQQHGKAQVVGIGGPLQLGQCRSKAALD